GAEDVTSEIGARGMSYLPELRESLVAAAERQAAGSAAEPASRRVRRRGARPFGAFALMFASVVAIAVAGIALVLVRHPGSQTAEPSSAARRLKLEQTAANAMMA